MVVATSVKVVGVFVRFRANRYNQVLGMRNSNHQVFLDCLAMERKHYKRFCGTRLEGWVIVSGHSQPKNDLGSSIRFWTALGTGRLYNCDKKVLKNDWVSFLVLVVWTALFYAFQTMSILYPACLSMPIMF
jgi:hypothetical protein